MAIIELTELTHTSPGVQTVAPEPTQTPFEQVSVAVQALPSLQGLSSAFLPNIHPPATVQ